MSRYVGCIVSCSNPIFDPAWWAVSEPFGYELCEHQENVRAQVVIARGLEVSAMRRKQSQCVCHATTVHRQMVARRDQGRDPAEHSAKKPRLPGCGVRRRATQNMGSGAIC